MQIVCNVFLYLDRVFVLHRSELASIWDFSVLLFRSHAMSDAQVEAALVSSLLSTIAGDRQSQMSDVGVLISRVFSMLSDLKVVEQWTYKVLAEATSAFFTLKAEEKKNSVLVSQYLEYARQRIDSETQRCENYGLEARFAAELLRRVREALVSVPLDAILRAGLGSLIEAENSPALALLCGLVQEQDFSVLVGHWTEYIKVKGAALLNDVIKEETAIAQVIELKDRLDRIVAGPFVDNKHLADAVKEASESFLNSRQNRPAELLARFVDSQMRGVSPDGTLSEEHIEASLGKVMNLFRLLQGKDLFGQLYKKDLARRLLYTRSVSLDLEKRFVARLREECGSTYTSHLESMFRDLDVTQETATAYANSDLGKHSKTSRTEFNSTLISYGIWPSAPIIKVNIPPSITAEQEKFTEFYHAQHRGRVLKYQQGLGHCIIKASFPLGVKELQVSIPQAVLLTMFNGGDENKEISYAEIQSHTGLDDVNLVRTLQSLACGKINILTKTPAGREVSVHDTFAFNKAFTSKHQRIRINTLSTARDAHTISEDNSIVSPEEAASDSQYRIDAAIVRILKQQKELAIEDLATAVGEQLKVPILRMELMKRIQVLLEREFISKEDGKDPHVYKYLA